MQQSLLKPNLEHGTVIFYTFWSGSNAEDYLDLIELVLMRCSYSLQMTEAHSLKRKARSYKMRSTASVQHTKKSRIHLPRMIQTEGPAHIFFSHLSVYICFPLSGHVFVWVKVKNTLPQPM